MLEGLEISIVKLSELDSIKKRYDAEYYQKKFILLENKINKIGKSNLNDINVKLSCSAFYPSITDSYNFESIGIPFLRVNEIQNGLININSDTAFLPANVLEENKKTIAIAHPDDIIIAKGGNTLAKLGLITKLYPYYALSRDLILVKTDEIKNCNKYFLWVFLHSQYGQDFLWRTASQTGQPHLTLPSIGEINIPRYSKTFENKFEFMYKKSIELKVYSETAYADAESLLLETIGLQNFSPCEESVNIKSFKDSFLTTGRLDAEYYQKKYEDYVNLIQGYKNGWNKLHIVCNLKDSNVKPDDDTEYKYIELSNIGASGNITGYMLANGIDLPSRARRLVNTHDVIISSIEGSLESCALVQEEYDNALCSTGFYVINSLEINPETLVVLFKSEPMQKILKKNCSGTILTAINKDEFLKLPVPIIEKSIQKKIATLVEKSFTLKKESEHLLEKAKRAVEIAIEKDEKTAIRFIESE